MQDLVQEFVSTVALYNRFTQKLETMKRQFAGVELFPSEIHTLVFIHENQDFNFSEIAAGRDITKGALTKTINKLEQKELLTKYNRGDNQKSVYFQLTDRGVGAVEAHEEFHRQFDFEYSQETQKFMAENRETIFKTFEHIKEIVGALNQKIQDEY